MFQLYAYKFQGNPVKILPRNQSEKANIVQKARKPENVLRSKKYLTIALARPVKRASAAGNAKEANGQAHE